LPTLSTLLNVKNAKIAFNGTKDTFQVRWLRFQTREDIQIPPSTEERFLRLTCLTRKKKRQARRMYRRPFAKGTTMQYAAYFWPWRNNPHGVYSKGTTAAWLTFLFLAVLIASLIVSMRPCWVNVTLGHRTPRLKHL
jgi:hypothetical protein